MNNRLMLACSLLAAVGMGCKPTYKPDPVVVDDEWQPAEEGVVYTLAGSQLDAAGKGTRVTIQAMQGLVNRSSPRVFFAVEGGDAHDANFFDALSRTYGIEAEPQQDPLWYVWAFADELDGYILYKNTNRDSATVATALAGVLNAVPIDQLSQEDLKLVDEELGLTQVLDVREWTQDDLLTSEYWGSFTPGMVMSEPFTGPENTSHDFGVSRGYPFYFGDPREDATLADYEPIWDAIGADAPVFGWTYTDSDYPAALFVEPLSERGAAFVPTDKANNLSFYAHYPLIGPMEQQAAEPVDDVVEKHFVAFVMSDGENVGTVMGRMTNPDVGHFSPTESYPMGWTLPGELYELAGPVLQYLYDSAHDSDAFILGASGHTLMYPSAWADTAAWKAATEADMEQLDTDYVTVLDVPDAFEAGSADPLAEIPRAKAVFFASNDDDPSSAEVDEWDAHEIRWVGDVPVIPMLKLGFEEDVEKTIDVIDDFAERVGERAVADVTSSFGYTVVYVNVHKTRLSDLEALEGEFEAWLDDAEADFDIEVIRPDQLVSVLLEHRPPG
jgi:hypothetical protein